jgi:hypothetical protein
MRHSIATVCLSGMLRDKLEAGPAAGVDRGEIIDTAQLHD